jgi:L-iditol 2-dehydrogenase
MTAVRAAVMRGPGEIGLERFPLPEPEPGAVLLRVSLSGICGTDKHTFRGETLQYAGTPHERRLAYPLICGHENVGTIAAIGGADEIAGADGRPLRVGDRIVPGANVPCGECWYCRTGEPYYLCERMEDYGNSLNAAEAPHLFGGWAEYLYLLPRTPLFPVPPSLPDEVAVLTEPMAVTHGIDRAEALRGGRPADSVVILGAGPLGICHLVKAVLRGATTLISVDKLPGRLGHAERLGATLTLQAGEPDVQARVRAATGGRGADLAVDCTGVPEGLVTALTLVRPGGVVVEAGAFVDLGPVAINPNADICTLDVAVLGVGGERADAYLPALDLLARSLDRLPLTEIVTHRFDLAEAGHALEVAQADGAMKVVLSGAG